MNHRYCDDEINLGNSTMPFVEEKSGNIIDDPIKT